MPVRPTLELGDPLLRQQAQLVSDPGAPEVQSLIADLWDTLRDFRQHNRWGRGLSAPVIGVGLRVVVLALEGQELVLINPRFESWGRAQGLDYECCITFGSIWGAVYRPEEVVVIALDGAGVEQRFEVSGDLARLMQHEIDHLDGLVWLDREPDLATICTTREWKLQRMEQQGRGQ